MADQTPSWNTFNAGELSPLIDGRTDQEKYFAGCKRLENFIPSVQGPVVRRGGTRYLGATKANGRVWLVPFEFSSIQSYMLEFGDGYIRFWTNRGQLLDSGLPYEIVSPWAASDLTTVEGTFALRTVQSGDVMWICHQNGTVQPYTLARFGATDWQLNKVLFRNGPFQDVDGQNAIVVSISASQGTGLNLWSSADLFRSTDVDTSFYLESQDLLSTPPWKVDTTTSTGTLRRYDGNVYQAVAVGSSGKTGNVPPTHLLGDAIDGEGGVTWRYLHSGYGWVRITAYVSPTQVTVDVISYVPGDIVGAGPGVFPPPVNPGNPGGTSPVYPNPKPPPEEIFT
jgi:hypothetical protein